MNYNNTMSYYPYNMYNSSVRRSPRRDDRLIGGAGNFLFPFALGFVSSPLVYGATRPRPYPYYGPVYRPYPYYPYY